MKVLIVEKHQNQTCRVDSNHRDQKACWDAKLAWLKEGNENNCDVFQEDYSVHKQQLCVAGTKLLVVHSIFTFARNNVIVEVKIAYPVDDALVEDSDRIWRPVHCSPVDESHRKHVEDGGRHHRPEVAFPPSVGKDDEDDKYERYDSL